MTWARGSTHDWHRSHGSFLRVFPKKIRPPGTSCPRYPFFLPKMCVDVQELRGLDQFCASKARRTINQPFGVGSNRFLSAGLESTVLSSFGGSRKPRLPLDPAKQHSQTNPFKEQESRNLQNTQLLTLMDTAFTLMDTAFGVQRLSETTKSKTSQPQDVVLAHPPLTFGSKMVVKVYIGLAISHEAR